MSLRSNLMNGVRRGGRFSLLMLQLLLKTSDIWKRPDNRQGWSRIGYGERDVAAEEADQRETRLW